jgi:hypothetical protein
MLKARGLARLISINPSGAKDPRAIKARGRRPPAGGAAALTVPPARP